MKKWIGFLAALLLAIATGPVFADHIEPAEPRAIQDKEAEREFNLGLDAFRHHNYKEAATHFQAALKKESNVPEFHIDLAMALAAEGQSNQAQKEFNQATDLIAKMATPPPDTQQG